MEKGWKSRSSAAMKRNHFHSDVNETRRRFYDLKKQGLKNEDAAAIAQGKLDPPADLGLPVPAPLQPLEEVPFTPNDPVDDQEAESDAPDPAPAVEAEGEELAEDLDEDLKPVD